MNERAKRVGENEALFREVNEKVDQLNRTLAAVGTQILIVCECGRQSCLERIDLTVDAYERVRADPALFAIRPGHDFPEVEDAVEQNEHYWIVRKKPGEPEKLAEATDPRS